MVKDGKHNSQKPVLNFLHKRLQPRYIDCVLRSDLRLGCSPACQRISTGVASNKPVVNPVMVNKVRDICTMCFDPVGGEGKPVPVKKGLNSLIQR